MTGMGGGVGGFNFLMLVESSITDIMVIPMDLVSGGGGGTL